ncbi:IscS subfamily cysteine desulfurase [Chitinophaga caeni]|uniref:cysteine desulfurase n=1 Tax=Chitinophaga caeni TaxID=2029983 RepID=A0A291R0R0_9BACT|nr:IscS subfamily cysteine desulfurase [Chitinophaga caeni]
MPMPIYLDNNATTACDPAVVDKMLPYFTEYYGNAASKHHRYGFLADAAVENARLQVAQLIGAQQQEIIFTSGATESVNMALKGVFESYAVKGNHIITTKAEHKAVLDTCQHLEKLGARVTYLPIDSTGQIDLKSLEAAISPETILICIMYANNELGTIYPVQKIAAIAKKHAVIFMCDATQATGKIPVDVEKDGIDILAMSAHKIYGPKGIGAVYIRRKSPRVHLLPLLDGGGQEKSLRPGTLNVPGIVGMGAACSLCLENMNGEANRLAGLRDRLESALLSIEGSILNGSAQNRLPHVTNIAFQYTPGAALIREASKSIAISTGSACTAASPEPSHVLTALGLGEALAHASLRFGLGRFTSTEDIDKAIEILTKTVAKVRSESMEWELYQSGETINPGDWQHPAMV